MDNDQDVVGRRAGLLLLLAARIYADRKGALGFIFLGEINHIPLFCLVKQLGIPLSLSDSLSLSPFCLSCGQWLILHILKTVFW